MLTPNYDLRNIQSLAFQLNSETNQLFCCFVGATGELTPQIIIDEFTAFEELFNQLKDQVDAIKQSIDSGHDPDRFLIL